MMKRLHPLLLAMALAVSDSSGAPKSPDREPAKDNSVEAELASFDVHEEFEVSLFADETLGIANPIAIQWDHRGRLWVLCTLAYAQLRPGEIPDDKLFILEDTDGDHRADQSTEFADGLDMPTGFALGNGGVYLGEGPDLVFLRDTDGDDQADERTVLLTGFGTGDTHQNISNFIFDSGGFLYFCQGLHAFSHVETPWGVSRGDRAGFWRFDPKTMRLDPFCFPGMTSANPCGIGFDRWGALFLKSNGPHLGFATPGLIPTTHVRELMQHSQVGATPGKSMGVDIVETAHQPAWLQNHAVIAGYFARQVTALPLIEEGSGFEVVEPVRLLTAGHESFRPVDIRMGPDGGIYIADWFNPVINHYQVSLRHPHRDYDHGRIWRLTAKGRDLAKPPALTKEAPVDLFASLGSDEGWARLQARRLLTEAEPDELTRWTKAVKPDKALTLIEGAGILESHGRLDAAILDLLQASPEPHARAVVARVIARAAEPIPDAYERLEKLLRDPHPRPRLEAVIACANRPNPDSLPLALLALDSDIDKHINYSLHQAVHALAESWLPALEAGEITFAQPEHLAFALEAYGGETAAKFSRAALEDETLTPETRRRFVEVLAQNGNAEDLRSILDQPHPDASLLALLVQKWPARRVKPAEPFADRLGELLDSESAAVRIAAIQLAGLWNAKELTDPVEQLAIDPKTPASVRSPALTSLAHLKGKAAADQLKAIALSEETPISLQRIALEALARVDIESAVATSVDFIQNAKPDDDLLPILNPILNKGLGPPALTKALADIDLTPEAAQQIAGALTRLGRSDLELTALLNRALGIDGGTDYDAERVHSIVKAVNAGDGDPKRGQAIYEMPQLTCVACHQVGGKGGILGPPLDAVGAGLPLDQIVDSVLYPARQLKEGYFATAITTVDGQVHTGYIDREAAGAIWLRDSATQELRPVSLHQEKERKGVGTLMPAGLTNTLTEAQLTDLIAFLASLKG